MTGDDGTRTYKSTVPQSGCGTARRYQRSGADRLERPRPKNGCGGRQAMISRSESPRAAGRRLRPAVVEPDEALRTLRLAAAACLREPFGVLLVSRRDRARGHDFKPVISVEREHVAVEDTAHYG
jgi:hypothetical protein